jgi:hypothetical protein
VEYGESSRRRKPQVCDYVGIFQKDRFYDKIGEFKRYLLDLILPYCGKCKIESK